MDLRFNQDDRFFAHDGIEPAPGDDDPIPVPDVEKILEDDMQDEEEDYDEDEDEDEENEDDDDDPDPLE